MYISFLRKGLNYYADLPSYPGSVEDTLMVGGAAEFLRKTKKTKFEVFTDEPSRFDYKLIKSREDSRWAYYHDDIFKLDIPLCPVAKWFFEKYPDNIWVQELQ